MTEKELAKRKKEAAKILGSMGGRATVEKYGRERMIELSKLGAAARWKKVKDERQKS